jgi:hypothetical protein
MLRMISLIGRQLRHACIVDEWLEATHWKEILCWGLGIHLGELLRFYRGLQIYYRAILNVRDWLWWSLLYAFFYLWILICYIWNYFQTFLFQTLIQYIRILVTNLIHIVLERFLAVISKQLPLIHLMQFISSHHLCGHIFWGENSEVSYFFSQMLLILGFWNFYTLRLLLSFLENTFFSQFS